LAFGAATRKKISVQLCRLLREELTEEPERGNPGPASLSGASGV
jgi:hypothetical protein